ncbi:MAG TPA: threonylcarbamoyl-AMP synthase [Oceanospirillales bacterium]|nr:threonylcarbamoyl-AMP synthase [Oceanospirillales bacterium]
MARIIYVHPDNPQPRLIKQAADSIRNGELIVYPTDSGYALGWAMDNVQAPKIVAKIRNIDKQHFFSIICDNISQISQFAIVDNVSFGIIKSHSPGAYTFILPATRRVPKKLQHQHRKSIGVRIPDHAVVAALVAELGEPFMSSSLELHDEDNFELDSQEINDRIGHALAFIIDSGYTPAEPSTVIELLDNGPTVLRVGKGVVDFV